MAYRPDIPPDELPFHYNREERLNQLPPEVKQRLTGRRKKLFIERRHLIVLIDIILVLVAFGGITAYQKGKAKAADFEGCRLQVMAVVYDGKVLSSLKVTANRQPEPGAVIRADFYFDGQNDPVTVMDLIPDRKGQSRLLRAELIPPEELSPLKVRVIIGENEKYLEKVIKDE